MRQPSFDDISEIEENDEAHQTILADAPSPIATSSTTRTERSRPPSRRSRAASEHSAIILQPRSSEILSLSDEEEVGQEDRMEGIETDDEWSGSERPQGDVVTDAVGKMMTRQEKGQGRSAWVMPRTVAGTMQAIANIPRDEVGRKAVVKMLAALMREQKKTEEEKGKTKRWETEAREAVRKWREAQVEIEDAKEEKGNAEAAAEEEKERRERIERKLTAEKEEARRKVREVEKEKEDLKRKTVRQTEHAEKMEERMEELQHINAQTKRSEEAWAENCRKLKEEKEKEVKKRKEEEEMRKKAVEEMGKIREEGRKLEAAAAVWKQNVEKMMEIRQQQLAETHKVEEERLRTALADVGETEKRLVDENTRLNELVRTKIAETATLEVQKAKMEDEVHQARTDQSSKQGVAERTLARLHDAEDRLSKMKQVATKKISEQTEQHNQQVAIINKLMGQHNAATDQTMKIEQLQEMLRTEREQAATVESSQAKMIAELRERLTQSSSGKSAATSTLQQQLAKERETRTLLEDMHHQDKEKINQLHTIIEELQRLTIREREEAEARRFPSEEPRQVGCRATCGAGIHGYGCPNAESLPATGKPASIGTFVHDTHEGLRRTTPGAPQVPADIQETLRKQAAAHQASMAEMEERMSARIAEMTRQIRWTTPEVSPTNREAETAAAIVTAATPIVLEKFHENTPITDWIAQVKTQATGRKWDAMRVPVQQALGTRYADIADWAKGWPKSVNELEKQMRNILKQRNSADMARRFNNTVKAGRDYTQFVGRLISCARQTGWPEELGVQNIKDKLPGDLAEKLHDVKTYDEVQPIVIKHDAYHSKDTVKVESDEERVRIVAAHDAKTVVRCQNCRKTGHSADDCWRGKGAICYKCGEKGHFAGQCTLNTFVCYTCKQPGHNARQCTQGMAPQQQQTTGKPMSQQQQQPQQQEAPKPKKKECLWCGKTGHMAAECRQLAALNLGKLAVRQVEAKPVFPLGQPEQE
jgi:hypothetical protein